MQSAPAWREVGLERRLATVPFTITAVVAAGGGVMGAKKLTLAFADDGRLQDVKWKEAPTGGDGWNNSPRRELGVYEVQKLFLDPEDYVVPPVVVRGIPFDVYRPVSAEPTANLSGTRCVYGVVAAWLVDAKQPECVFDRKRIASDSRYAYHFGNLNILHHLVQHRDARTSNFLISADPADPRIFSVDNGISFGSTLFNFFTWHFDKIRVDRLPRKSIDRLRRLKRADLDRLALLSELRTDADGVLRQVGCSPNLDRDEGNRVAPGVVQIGLTSAEIDRVALRIQKLLDRVARGRLAVF